MKLSGIACYLAAFTIQTPNNLDGGKNMSGTEDPDFVHEFELETWTRCAGDYLKGFAGLTRETIPIVVEEAGVKAGQRVLDVGAGPGHICGSLSSMGCSAVGIDFSEAMVAIAKENYPEAEFHEGNAADLPFEDVEFDSVISNFVVHHLAKPKDVFAEVHRVLKDEGGFAYAVFAAPEEQSSIGEFFAAVEEFHTVEELPHGPLFGVTDIEVHRDLLEAGGFTTTSFEFHPITWKAESPDDVFSAFSDWGNLDALPKETAGKIREATLARYENYRTGGIYEFPHTALVAHAVK